MTKGIFVVGTDTDVGKTLVAAAILHVLRSSGYNATYFKAALSGAVKVDGVLVPGDTAIVCDVGRLSEPYENMTPYIYQTPVSPHLAAQIEGRPIDIAKIKSCLNQLKAGYEVIVAEGSGGILCPLIDDKKSVYTVTDLIQEFKREMDMAVVVVARAGVGTINHTVLTTAYLKSRGIEVAGIIISGYEDNPVYEDNIAMIECMSDAPVIARFEQLESLTSNEGRLNFDELDQEGRSILIRKAAEKCFSARQLMDLIK